MSKTIASGLRSHKEARQIIYDRLHKWEPELGSGKAGGRLAELLGYPDWKAMVEALGSEGSPKHILHGLAGPNGYAIYRAICVRRDPDGS